MKVRCPLPAMLALVVLLGSTQQAAGVVSAWVRTYGGPSGQGAADVSQTADGGFIAAGWTRSFGAGDADLWIVRVDSGGGVLWQRAYGGSGLDEIFRIQPTSDGGYVAVGLSGSFGVAQHAPLVIKIDASGNIQWENTYPATGRDWGNSIAQTSDGGYIVAGGTDPPPLGGNDQEATLLKLDANGAIEWQRVFATAGGLMYDALQTADGGYLATGEAIAGGSSDILVVKLDAAGTVQWQKQYGGAGNESPRALQPTNDGGYFVAGSTTSFGVSGRDAWLLKLGADGSIGWQRAYGGSSTDTASSVQQTIDGGYIVGGGTTSFGSTGSDSWVLKLDPLGNVDWQRSYDSGAPEDDARAVRATSDGGYIVAGFTDPGCLLCPPSPTPDNFSLLKLTSDGSIDASCPVAVGALILNAAVLKTTAVAQVATVGSGEFTATANAVNVAVTDTSAQPQTVCTNNCGNGQLDPGEQCDDSNTQNRDCCSSTCQFEALGSPCASSGNVCITDTCNGAGTCTHVNNTAPCDDGNACTTGDTCGGGACIGDTPRNCDDSNVCTNDSCNPLTGCVYTGNTNPCDDGDSCTGGDQCGGGVCVGGPPPSCDDGNPCTDDSCPSSSGCVHTPATCSDGNVCTTDTCDPATGCIFTNNTAACEGDGNFCTAEQCDGTGRCVFVSDKPAGSSCDDGVLCTGTDTCDAAGSCLHSGDPCPATPCNTCQVTTGTCFDQAGTVCDDADGGTADDTCNGAGVCAGQAVTGKYAILRWMPQAVVSARLRRDTRATGNTCVDVVVVRQNVEVDGNLVATASTGTAVKFSIYDHITGNLVTGNGRIGGRGRGTQRVDGIVDIGGVTPVGMAALDDCAAASFRAETRRTEFSALNATMTLGPIKVRHWRTQTINAGAGTVVIDLPEIVLKTGATLTLAGGPLTQVVIVRVAGKMKLSRQAAIELRGMTPGQVIFIGEGPVKTGLKSTIAGTVFSKGSIRIGRDSTIHGQLLGAGTIRVQQSVILDPTAFVGW